jgi:hypothetical protein
MHRNITRKLLVQLSLSQTNKNVIFFFLSFLFCKIGEQEGGIGPAQGRGLATVEGAGGRERG